MFSVSPSGDRSHTLWAAAGWRKGALISVALPWDRVSTRSRLPTPVRYVAPRGPVRGGLSLWGGASHARVMDPLLLPNLVGFLESVSPDLLYGLRKTCKDFQWLGFL